MEGGQKLLQLSQNKQHEVYKIIDSIIYYIIRWFTIMTLWIIDTYTKNKYKHTKENILCVNWFLNIYDGVIRYTSLRLLILSSLIFFLGTHNIVYSK